MVLATYSFLDILTNLLLASPYTFISLGMVASVGVSVLGAAWGILLTASSLMASSIRTTFKSKHLISILFCEAVAIYGLIACFVFIVRPAPPDP